MGVDVDPETVIGIPFKTSSDAVEWAMENKLLPQMDDEEFEDVDINEYLEELYDIGLSYTEYSGYNDYGGMIGIDVGSDDLGYKSDKVDKIWEKLYEVIPKEYHDKITCQMWARYW